MSSTMGQVAGSGADTTRQAREWLEAHTRIDGAGREALAALAPILLARALQGARPTVCISGPPGCGKSTLAGLLAFLLTESGRPAVRLSLDDYYLDQRQRELLSRSVHPLLLHRGVPGTHDWPGLLHDFDILRTGHTGCLELRAFDKSRDTTAPADAWRVIDQPVEFTLLEGWCLGVPPQAVTALGVPLNRLEADQDREGSWRRFVNDQLAQYHRDLAARIGQYWYLAVPDWSCVLNWRWQQEQESEAPLFREREAVVAFLQPFGRIVRHAQATAFDWADCLLQADPWHCLSIPPGTVKPR